jgi:CheY-like chemotaxis protein
MLLLEGIAAMNAVFAALRHLRSLTYEQSTAAGLQHFAEPIAPIAEPAFRSNLCLAKSFEGKITTPRKTMSKLRILIVEDDPWIGAILQDLILQAADAEIGAYRSVAEAEKALAEHEFDLAFLDANVTNGQTFGVAARLMDHDVPFVFMSGYPAQNQVPDNLRHVPFLARPFRLAQVQSILRAL